MEKEKIKLTVKELQNIVFDDSEEFDVIQHEIVGNWRHGTEETSIVKRIIDGKYFKLNYRNSVKDSCEFEDMNFDDEYEEVFPIEKTIIIYE